AMISRDDIARTSDDAGERSADGLEDVVTGLAAELAVEGAEVIDVDEDERERYAVAPRAPPFAFEKFEELLVIGHRGQRVFSAHALQLDARGFELRRPRFERSLERDGAHVLALPADVCPDAECRERSNQCGNDRQPVLHWSLHWCTCC